MKQLLSSILAILVWSSCNGKANTDSVVAASTPMLLPSEFLNGERFYIKMKSATGDTILAYGDSGGGICFLAPGELEKLHLEGMQQEGYIKHIKKMNYIDFKDLVADKNIPAPQPNVNFTLSRHFKTITSPYFLVADTTGEFKEIATLIKMMPFDAFLGQNYFMGRAWTFDYPKQQIWINTSIATDATAANIREIRFKKDAEGHAIYGHGRISIKVDGEDIDVLFDTGATIFLTDSGNNSLNTTERSVAGSFIAKSIFDKWREKHPDWKYFEKADKANNADVIEVPQITVGVRTVGPVLFAVRPDEVWSNGMIGSMDKVVKGAIGGSALKYFKVTVDYNTEKIKFE